MPQRPFTRSLQWLVPPSLDDWVPADHPVRFVADVLDGFDGATWAELGITRTPERRGAPRYAPEVLLALWLYGFSVGIRSSRGLEAACRDQIPFRWLSGNQTPDHNTLFRFLQQHPTAMSALYGQTVRIAVHAGLVDWALQAVDGTKIGANAAVERTVTVEDLDRLEAALDRRIAEVLAETADRQTRDEPGPPTLPPALQEATERQERIAAVRAELAQRTSQTGNLTDPEARLMKTRQGIVPAYNAQAVVSVVPSPASAPAGTPSGRLIVGAAVTTAAHDRGQLPAMIADAAARTGQLAAVTVADKGYFSTAAIAACADADQPVVVPEPTVHRTGAEDLFALADFAYDPVTDTYTCPAGQVLPFRDQRRDGAVQVRRYRAAAATCRTCPLRDQCTRSQRHGRALAVPVGSEHLPAHRAWMATEPAQAASRQRRQLIEPVFGILKEQLRARRFLRRGLGAVQAEWALLCAAFNLRTLTRWWQQAGTAAPGTSRVWGRVSTG
jgi:transposase